MTELQELAREMLKTIEREDFEHDYRKNGKYRCSTVAKFIQQVHRSIQ